MDPDLFPGPVGPLPEAMSRRFAVFRPVSEMPAPVRFAEGYGRFAQYLRELGADPGLLAADLGALWTFLAGRSAVLVSVELADSAAVFAGNVLAMMHPAATWRVTDGPEIGTETRSIPVAGLVQTMVEHPERRDAFLEMLRSWDQDDRDEQERRRLTRETAGPALVVPPAPFTRPPFPQRTFLDEKGEVVQYGFQWVDSDAPAEAYSRVSNPDRFAPLRLDVEAIVGHLQAWYAVDVDRTFSDDRGVEVRLRPATGAPMTIRATSESVMVEAGALFRLVVPDCSCDACDETAESEAGRLEEAVLAIAAGGLQERYPLGRRRWLHTRLRFVDGGGSSSTGEPDADVPRARLDEARTVLQDLDGGWWPSWPLRARPENRSAS